MSNRLVQYGFTAGIVSRNLWGQTVLEKYGFGLADSKNFIIDYTGTLISRGGLVADRLTDISEGDVFRFVPFIFAKEDANTFALLFTDSKVRFLQQGAYQLEAAKAVTAITNNASYTEFACTSHGYSVGDLVEFYGDDVPTQLVGQTVEVSAVPNANTFRCTPINLPGTNLDSWSDASTSAVDAYRVYTLATPWDDDDLPNLYFTQARDQVTITSLTYTPYTLERQTDGTWVLAEEAFENGAEIPENIGKKGGSATANYGGFYAVTSFNQNGEESLPGFYFDNNVSDMVTIAGNWVIEWDTIPDAIKYNIYRTSLYNRDWSSSGNPFGYIGTTKGNHFYDDGIIADFTSSFPIERNPFAHGYIKYVEVTAGGSGYAVDDTITVNDTGAGEGAILVPMVDRDNSNAIEGVLIISPGKNYENPSIAITTSGGSGATFTITLGEDEGNFPAISALYQQRKVYAGSTNYPMVMWGSNIGLFANFAVSDAAADDESWEYEFSSKQVGALKHLVETGAGLLAFSNLGVWLAAGTQEGAITPTDVQLDRQTAIGCSDLVPMLIDADVVYSEVDNRAVRLLQYNDFSTRYGGLNISILAADLFANPYSFAQWTYEMRPYSVIYMVRSDGQMLGGTVVSEQQVYAWGRHDTAGLFAATVTLPESPREVTYCLVKRYLSGRWCYTIEHFADRTQSTNEDHVGVDCAVPFGGNYPAANLSFASDGITVTASAAVFSSGNVGDFIRYRSGKAVIDQFNSSTEVEVTVINEFTDIVIPYVSETKTIPSGEWLLTTDLSSYTLPLNFRPSSVSVIGDGKVETANTPSGSGVVTFSEDYSYGYIGLPYTCRAQTLPLHADGALIEDSRKLIQGVGLRYNESRYIEVGTSLDDMFPIYELDHTVVGEPAMLQSGRQYIAISDEWEEDTQVYMQADGAYMTAISSIVFDVDVGDEVS